MPLGNGNAKSGDHGSNWKFEFQLLTGIQSIANNTGGIFAGGATSANQVIEIGVLNGILSALNQGQAYTQALVVDNGGTGCPNNCPTYLEIRVWDSTTQTFGPPIYYDAMGNVVTPVGPVVYLNNAFTLNSILIQDTAINVSTAALNAKMNSLGQKVMAGSMPVVIASDQTAIPVTFTPTGTQNTNLIEVGGSAISIGQQLTTASLPVVLPASQITALTPLSTVAVTQSTSPWVTSVTGTVAVSGTVAATQSGSWSVSVIGTVPVSGTVAISSLPLPTGASTSANQATEITALQTLVTDFTPATRTPSLLDTTTAGTVAAGARSVSVFNSGTNSGTWLGAIIPAGVQLSYEAGGQGDTLAAFAYDPTTGGGTTFIITQVV